MRFWILDFGLEPKSCRRHIEKHFGGLYSNRKSKIGDSAERAGAGGQVIR